MNIYNFAGNEGEWTLEKTSGSYSPCARRGGYYHRAGSYNTAFSRIGSGVFDANLDIGFRATLYVN